MVLHYFDRNTVVILFSPESVQMEKHTLRLKRKLKQLKENLVYDPIPRSTPRLTLIPFICIVSVGIGVGECE